MVCATVSTGVDEASAPYSVLAKIASKLVIVMPCFIQS